MFIFLLLRILNILFHNRKKDENKWKKRGRKKKKTKRKHRGDPHLLFILSSQLSYPYYRYLLQSNRVYELLYLGYILLLSIRFRLSLVLGPFVPFGFSLFDFKFALVSCDYSQGDELRRVYRVRMLKKGKRETNLEVKCSWSGCGVVTNSDLFEETV